jgi:hypothetical protein
MSGLLLERAQSSGALPGLLESIRPPGAAGAARVDHAAARAGAASGVQFQGSN